MYVHKCWHFTALLTSTCRLALLLLVALVLLHSRNLRTVCILIFNQGPYASGPSGTLHARRESKLPIGSARQMLLEGVGA